MADAEFRIRSRGPRGRYFWVRLDSETERVLATGIEHKTLQAALDDAFASGATTEHGALVYESNAGDE